MCLPEKFQVTSTTEVFLGARETIALLKCPASARGPTRSQHSPQQSNKQVKYQQNELKHAGHTEQQLACLTN